MKLRTQPAFGLTLATPAGADALRAVSLRGEERLSAPFEDVVQAEAVALEGEYAAVFDALPVDRPCRPPLHTPRPRMAGPQTAVAVGGAGEESWTDEHGRVTVRFNRDREGRNDENASCRLRVAQVWAGAGSGAFVLSRIGQEVAVGFLDGEPDRPLTGVVCNGANPLPCALPAQQTRTVLKSDSSKDAKGSNDLRFEHKAGDDALDGPMTIFAPSGERAAVLPWRASVPPGTMEVFDPLGRPVMRIEHADGLRHGPTVTLDAEGREVAREQWAAGRPVAGQGPADAVATRSAAPDPAAGFNARHAQEARLSSPAPSSDRRSCTTSSRRRRPEAASRPSPRAGCRSAGRRATVKRRGGRVGAAAAAPPRTARGTGALRNRRRRKWRPLAHATISMKSILTILLIESTILGALVR